jgi:hypothetical protein
MGKRIVLGEIETGSYVSRGALSMQTYLTKSKQPSKQFSTEESPLSQDAAWLIIQRHFYQSTSHLSEARKSTLHECH